MNEEKPNTIFLKRFTAEYDLDKITKDKALYLQNNIQYGGRVANFVIDFLDISYFNDVIEIIFGPIDSGPAINDFAAFMECIDKIVCWIQLRLNTRFLFNNKDWDYFNERFIQQCFGKEDFKQMSKYHLKDTNIRNLFFGDCREHEVLLHILTKLFIKRYNLQDKYMVRRIYAKGITIKDKFEFRKHKGENIDNDKYGYAPVYESKELPRSSMSGGYRDASLEYWDHTHPLLYDIEQDKLYSIDALQYKTVWNPTCDPTHNVELELINLNPNASCIPHLNYKEMLDSEYRTYIEIPTPFSHIEPTVINRQESILFSHKFVLNTHKLTGIRKYTTYAKHKVIDIGDLVMSEDTTTPYAELFSRTIDILCLKKKELFNPAKIKRNATIHSISSEVMHNTPASSLPFSRTQTVSNTESNTHAKVKPIRIQSLRRLATSPSVSNVRSNASRRTRARSPVPDIPRAQST